MKSYEFSAEAELERSDAVIVWGGGNYLEEAISGLKVKDEGFYYLPSSKSDETPAGWSRVSALDDLLRFESPLILLAFGNREDCKKAISEAKMKLEHPKVDHFSNYCGDVISLFLAAGVGLLRLFRF